MRLYLDADVFLAIAKPTDWLKRAAVSYLQSNKGKYEFVSSSITLLEIWFKLRAATPPGMAAMAVKDACIISHILPTTQENIVAALAISQKYGLSPADSIHAQHALPLDAIVSTDSSFDRVKGLKRIDFSKKR